MELRLRRNLDQLLKSQGYHLYILSNYSQFMLDQTRPGKMPFLKNMDGVIFSCEVQQIKPEADIYETLLSRFGLKTGGERFPG